MKTSWTTKLDGAEFKIMRLAPGPWHVGTSESHHCVYDEHGWQIADASPLGKDADTKANAQLIAAAPDILTALTAVFNELSAESRSISSYLTPATVQAVRIALLKTLP